MSSTLDVMGEKMENVIGTIEAELDGRFANIRTQETNLGVRIVLMIPLHVKSYFCISSIFSKYKSYTR